MNISHLKKQKNISILILVRTAPFNKHRYIFPTELQIRHTLQVIFDLKSKSFPKLIWLCHAFPGWFYC